MLGATFLMEVEGGVELVVVCVVSLVVRLVVWCVKGREYFLCCFSLKSVEMSGLSVGGFFLGVVIWADCFILLERDFLGNMVGADVLLDMVVVEVILVETVDLVQVRCFVFFWCGYLVDMMGVRMVIEVVVGEWVLVDVVEVLCSVRMGVGVGGVENRGGGVVSGRGNASVADGGADVEGGARWRDCCRFPDGIFRELWEVLPYCCPFTLDISDFFL